MSTFEISTFRSAFDRYPRAKSPTWQGLVTALTRFRVFPGLPWWCKECDEAGPHEQGPECPKCGGERKLDKRRVPAWSPAVYPEGETRSRAAVHRLSLLVLDVDDGQTMDEARECWSSWPFVLHTSWSHTPEHHKFRVVLPLERPVPAHLWPRVWKWAEQHSGRAIDKACKDPSRIYFVPAVRSEDWPRHAEVVDEGGHLLDIDAESLPEPEEEKRLRAKTRPRPPVRYPKGTPEWKVRRAQQERLKNDSGARLRAAHVLDGRLQGASLRQRATGIACPQCGRPSVWFWIHPDRAAGAACDHRNSCGWRGWLDELLDAHTGAAA